MRLNRHRHLKCHHKLPFLGVANLVVLLVFVYNKDNQPIIMEVQVVATAFGI